MNKLALVEQYLRAAKLFRDYSNTKEDPAFSRVSTVYCILCKLGHVLIDLNPFQLCLKVIELDLSSIEPCLSGPKRPHDQVTVKHLKEEFSKGLMDKVSFKVKLYTFFNKDYCKSFIM